MATPTHPGKFDKLLLSEPVQSRMQEALKDIRDLCESYISLLGNPLLRFGIFSNINWQFKRYHNQSILIGEFESLLIFFFFFFFKRVLRVRAYWPCLLVARISLPFLIVVYLPHLVEEFQFFILKQLLLILLLYIFFIFFFFLFGIFHLGLAWLTARFLTTAAISWLVVFPINFMLAFLQFDEIRSSNILLFNLE